MDDLRFAQPDWNVEIVVINPADRAQYASLAASATTLPWLQDTSAQSVWTRWARAKDELCIVDTLGRVLTVTNLGLASLEIPLNREALRHALLNAARAVDVDEDALPDTWEEHHFGSLAPGATDDRDGDGRNALAEFAFGTDPTAVELPPPLSGPVLAGGDPPRLVIGYRRRIGSLVDYRFESSADFQDWQTLPPSQVVGSAPRNLFDGLGLAQAQAVIRLEPSPGSSRFLRLRAHPRP